MLTYLANLEAKTAVWICEGPQPEHVEAINRWNKNGPPDVAFYMVKLEVFQIEGSPPAPHLSVVAGPSEQIKRAGAMKGELAERHLKRLKFWKELLEKSNAKTELFSNVYPSKECSIRTGAGKSGLSYRYTILKNSARIELYIDTGDEDRNNQIFDQLYSKRQEIESDFGDELEWQRPDDRRACRIAKTVENKGLWDTDNWPIIQDKMIDAMIRFEKALSKHIQRLE